MNPPPGPLPLGRGVSDAELLRAMHGGDERAAAELYARIGPRTAAAVRVMLRESGGMGGTGEAGAEDAVQEAMIRLVGMPRDEIAAIADPLAWLVRAARRLALNAARGEGRRGARERELALADRVRESGVTENFVLGFEDLSRAMEKMSDAEREVIALRHVAGLTFDQMAFALDEPRSTAATRYRGAMARLRAAMGAAEVSHVR